MQRRFKNDSKDSLTFDLDHPKPDTFIMQCLTFVLICIYYKEVANNKIHTNVLYVL